MSEEVLINVTPQEIRVALVENGVLQEVQIERSRNKGLLGNIYKGRVSRVLPGMQAAFVDIGLERAGFLHAADVMGAIGEREDALVDTGEPPMEPSHAPRPISELLYEGQQIVVQVVKDPLGTKGARLTTHITLPARFLVYMPFVRHLGISARIEVLEERARLKGIMEKLISAEEEGGYIIRTLAEGASEEELARDMAFLKKLWHTVRARIEESPAPAEVHQDLNLAMRTMRDVISHEIQKVRIDSRETYQVALRFAEKLIPEVAACIELYTGERPLFELYSVEDEIARALDRKVPLKSGGYLIIDQTEALTTIDVNTGAFVGKRNLEETILKTNLEAASAIARQLRLRNLGGIIILDFIDMHNEEHKRRVYRALEKCLARDRVRTTLTPISALGLIEMTRKRTRESLARVLCEPCPYCAGRAVMKTAQTVCYEVFREIMRECRAYPAEKFMVLASRKVVDMLLDEENTGLAMLEEFIKRPITLQVDSDYTQEQFDIVLM